MASHKSNVGNCTWKLVLRLFLVKKLSSKTWFIYCVSCDEDMRTCRLDLFYFLNVLTFNFRILIWRCGFLFTKNHNKRTTFSQILTSTWNADSIESTQLLLYWSTLLEYLNVTRFYLYQIARVHDIKNFGVYAWNLDSRKVNLVAFIPVYCWKDILTASFAWMRLKACPASDVACVKIYFHDCCTQVFGAYIQLYFTIPHTNLCYN